MGFYHVPRETEKKKKKRASTIRGEVGVPVDGGGEEDEVGAQQVLDHGQRDGGGLIHHHQFCLCEASVV